MSNLICTGYTICDIMGRVVVNCMGRAVICTVVKEFFVFDVLKRRLFDTFLSQTLY